MFKFAKLISKTSRGIRRMHTPDGLIIHSKIPKRFEEFDEIHILDNSIGHDILKNSIEHDMFMLKNSIEHDMFILKNSIEHDIREIDLNYDWIKTMILIFAPPICGMMYITFDSKIKEINHDIKQLDNRINKLEERINKH